MFFGDVYDKSLYLIIKYNKRDRDMLLDFLKIIPLEFKMMIRDKICEYEKNVSMGLSASNNDYNLDIYTKEGYLYLFNIDINTGLLSISRSFYQYGAYYKELEVKLFKYNNMDSYDRKDVGGICYGFNNNIDVNRNNRLSRLKEYNYRVLNISYKNILLLFENNRFIGIEKIDMNNIDNDLCDKMVYNNKKRCLRKDKYDI